MAAALAAGCFDWSSWQRRASVPQVPAPLALRPKPAKGPDPALQGEADRLPALLEAFEVANFADPRRRRQPAGSRSTWRAAYRPYLRRLEQLAGPGAELTLPLLEEVLETYVLASRSRQQCGIALAALARHRQLELPADWSERSGGYGLHLARFRQLPTDDQIRELVERIPNPGWRLAYGLMATYGLRNHEVFFCDCAALAPGGDQVIRVLPTSKTGEHQVWPFQPEWIDHFELERLGRDPNALPIVNGLLFGIKIWFHELGHATIAWLAGRQALPLPIGWTSYNPTTPATNEQGTPLSQYFMYVHIIFL